MRSERGPQTGDGRGLLGREARYAGGLERLERKYLVAEPQVAAIRRAVRTYCEPDSHCRPDGTYLITSLYLDTPTLACHRATVRNDLERYKLRIRTYDGNGDAFLEVKHKVKDVINKQRAVVARERARDAARGVAVPTRNGGGRALEAFGNLCLRGGAEPVLLVRYEREAWVSAVDSYARVTFDRRLVYQPTRDWELGGAAEGWERLDGYWQFDGLQSPVVLELKCEQRVPHWMAEIARAFSLEHDGFSKYSRSVLAAQRLERGLMVHRHG